MALDHRFQRLGAEHVGIGAPDHEDRDLAKRDELRPEVRHWAAEIDGAERAGQPSV